MTASPTPASPDAAHAAPDAVALLERFSTLHPRAWDLGLERLVRLLADMGNPQERLPPVFHVAGTNGKGSTVAFLRAGIEAQGRRAHAYTSPHLVRFNERIRLAGRLVDDATLVAALMRCERVNAGQPITFFEATTAVALDLFAATPADATLLEVGLGGRLDATNVVARPAMCAITPVSMDHMAFLGDTLEKIAAEKAGILKRGVPCVVAPQDPRALEVIRAVAARVGAPLVVHGQDYMAHEEHGRLVYQDGQGLLDLPLPRLPGRHQIINAGTALACLRHAGMAGTSAELAEAMQRVTWPARLQKLTGALAALAPGCDVWLDGGHNAGGGQALAEAMADLEDRVPRRLCLVSGMLRTKEARAFFRPFEGLAWKVVAVPIPGHDKALEPDEVAAAAEEAGTPAVAAEGLEAAVAAIAAEAEEPVRILVCGSLYLAGHALRADGYVPD